MRRGLRSHPIRIYGCGISPHDRLVEGILHMRRRVRHAVKHLHVRFVLGEEERARSFANQSVFTERVMARFDHPQRLGVIAPDAQIRPPLVLVPSSRYCETRASAADEARLLPARDL